MKAFNGALQRGQSNEIRFDMDGIPLAVGVSKRRRVFPKGALSETLDHFAWKRGRHFL